MEEEARMRRGPMARPAARIEHLRFAEQDIYFLSASDVPFAPAWCLTRKELIVAAFPQQIKAYLSRGADFKSLATVPEVAAAFAGGEGPIGLSVLRRPQDSRLPVPHALHGRFRWPAGNWPGKGST